MNFHTNIPKYVIVCIWLGINVYLFVSQYLLFANAKKYFYLKYIIKDGLPVARGSASVLKFNCMLILLPVCRNLLSCIKNIPCMPRKLSRVLDYNIEFHKMVAYTICVATIVHTGAHVYNFENLVSSWQDTDVVTMFLNMYEDTAGTTRLNPVRDRGLDPIIQLVSTVAGVTGVVITFVLILMVASSTEFIRRSYFELFWYVHHLFVLFFIGLILHGFGYMLRYQDNTDVHDPEVCVNSTLWTSKQCRVNPNFVAGSPTSWQWVLVPLVLYFIEKTFRFVRSLQPCTIKKIVRHPSRVLEVQMTKSGFRSEPGQYIFLQCSNISKLEWHPFTLTSCPEEDFFSVHIRLAGDWTEELAKKCEEGGDLKVNLACDGPFGTASSDVFKYKTIVCVGAGIGVTPFASILKSIWYRRQKNDDLVKVKKVYFYWICPDTNAFEWFADLLMSLEQQTQELGCGDFIDYQIYLTRGWNEDDVWNIALHDSTLRDAVTGLNSKTNFGRPDWTKVFSQVSATHRGSTVGVFFCGPPVLSDTLKKNSEKFSDRETKFVYNKENF